MAEKIPQDIPAIFSDRIVHRGDELALGFVCQRQLHWRSWRELAADVERQAAAILAAGICPGDRVAQISENRYEWVILDLAIHTIGAVHVPVHATLSGEQIAEQIALTDAQLVFVSNENLLAKFADGLRDKVTVFNHTPPLAPSSQPLVPHLQSPAPDDLATILFTSGTTGQPRGVMLSGQNLASNAATMARMMPPEDDELRLCMLPLSHIYARTCDLYLWLCRGTRLVLAESKETVLRDCQMARPTTIRAVPYFYQKLAQRIRSAEGDQRAALQHTLGGRIRHCFCGGAGLDDATATWFAEQGLPVYCGYGLTEAAPVITASMPGVHRQGTVGRPLDGVEVRLAEDGEILARGPNVMLGYWQDEAATAEAIREGWLHTGDLGRWEDGFLVVDGRKKELIVLTTGKKVSPMRVEAQLTGSPWIAQAMVFGDGRSHLGALIVPDRVALEGIDEAGVRAVIEREIAARQTGAAREEQVRTLTVLERPFSAERGELTSKGGLCRATILKNFAAEIQGTYQLQGMPETAPSA